jgi:hypothetical protein
MAKPKRCKAKTNAGKRCSNPAGPDGICHIESHRDQAVGASESVTGADLSSRELVAIESLVARGAKETLADVAERAGVTVRTLYRYMQQDAFVGELRKRIEDELGGARARVAAALIKGAIMPGKGQAAMQKIYWQRLGELIDKRQIDDRRPPPQITVAPGTTMDSHAGQSEADDA